MTRDAAAMVTEARRANAPVVVVEVRRKRDHRTPGAPEVLALHAILAAPGYGDSRYRVVDLAELAADTPATTEAALTIARDVAAQLGAPLDPPGAIDAPRWLARQGPSPDRSWTIGWTRTTWRDDGVAVVATGHATVIATGAGQARHRAAQVAIEGHARPLVIEIAPFDGDAGDRCIYGAAFPVAAGDPFALRAAARDGAPLSAILAGMRAAAPAITPLALVVAVAEAFDLTIDTLAPVGAFGRGELDAAGLDAAIGPAIAARRAHWALPLALRESGGVAVGPVLRAAYPAVGVIELMRATMDAFEVGLDTAKAAVLWACDGQHDASVDLEVQARRRR